MRTLALLPALTALAVLARPAPADACGGTFCDNGGPRPMPVEQTGENIVFVVDEGFVEAHIQIQYDPRTEASQFAWIVPVLGTPEFSVGSQQLVIDLLNTSRPGFGVVRTAEDCWGEEGGYDGGFDSCDGGLSSAGGDEGGGETGGGGTDTTGGTDVLLEVTVGAFDVVVLQAPSAAELMTWLGDNGYFQDPNAEPILQQYVDEGAQFAAFRLTQGADVGEIHPVVVRYAGSEPCIPIRLTRIAAKDDMDIRALFLGDTRVVSTNYRHVVINDLQLDWGNFVPDWKDSVTLAIDEADLGHAWVTEYAGTSTIVPTDALWNASWNAAPFEAIAPVDVIDELGTQGLVTCGMLSCDYEHPLILGLLRQWLPAPVGVTESEFYACLSCYADEIDPMAWNGSELAQALQERIIDPGAHARDVVMAHPYLTRLYTTLSPAEMTADPLFAENPDLGEIDMRVTNANVLDQCNGIEHVDLPSGRAIDLSGQTEWPDIYPGQMPFAERIEEMGVAGAPIVVVDNAALIDDLLAMWQMMNAANGPQQSCHDTGESASASGTASAGDGTGFTGTSGEGGADGGDGSSGGCGCAATPRPTPTWMMLLVLLGAMPRRYRRA